MNAARYKAWEAMKLLLRKGANPKLSNTVSLKLQIDDGDYLIPN
jgi:hypothetical protein